MQSRFPIYRQTWLVILTLAMLGSTAGNVGAQDQVDFNADIRPILSSSCFTCHGPDEAAREAGLRLDTFAGATEDLGGYAAIKPGTPDESELINRILTDDDDLRMPPVGVGKRLENSEVDLIRRWIAQGAKYAQHWSYAKPDKAPLPAVSDKAWPSEPIDNFILSRLDAAGLQTSPPAERRAIARRVALALTGLPPDVEQVEAFVANQDPDAYEQFVDQLLNSPAFGERWARVWLDLARYADSAGYADDPARTIWAYRDYVVRSLNANKPFDQFTIEQIAGDLLDSPSEEQLIATAFHRNTMTNNEGGTNDEQFRNEAIVDRVNTTMAVWMGTTMACAQCHSHKYDPISQNEYFQFFDFFNQSQDADRRDESPFIEIYSDEQESRKLALRASIDELKSTLAQQTPQLDTAMDAWLAGLRQPPQWQPVTPASGRVMLAGETPAATDQSQPDLSIDDQGKVTLLGERPDQATYQLRIPITQPQSLTAVRLNVSDQQASNFVLSRATLTWEPQQAQPINGQFVRVELPGKSRLLHLAEVEVLGKGENLALKGKATQSSTDYGAPPERGNDGTTNGDFNAGSVTHAAQEDNPWWEVDLGSLQPIDSITIWNRTDGGQSISDRLAGYELTVLDADRNVVWKGGGMELQQANLVHALSGNRPLTIRAANADYSQPNFDAASVLAGIAANKPTGNKTGWAVGGATSTDHQLVLSLAAAEQLEAGELVVTLEQVSVHTKHVLTHFQLEVTSDEDVTRWAALPNNVRSLVLAPSLDDAQRQEVANYFRTVTPLLDQQRQALQKAEAELAAIKPMTTVPIMRDLSSEKRRVTKVQIRGNYQSTAEEVSAGVPSAFHALPTDAPANRLALAQWLVSPENPLTARVVVNRHWEQIFGIGLVETSEEFGSQGELPSHPALLDWLAVDLMEHGWDIKRLVKQMVMSATYRQSSKVDAELLEADPENRLYARGPRFRISAEMVRDQALKVAGLLSSTMYGPPVRPPQPSMGLSAAFGSATDWQTSEGGDRYRRGLYTTWRRSNPYPSMATFDAPNREVCTLRRSRTNTPLQALVTLNDPVYVEAAQSLARITDSNQPVAKQLEQIFKQALQRPPSDAELQRLSKLYEELSATYQPQPEQARKIAEDPLGPLPPDADPIHRAALTIVANAILNLDEMLMPR